MLLYTLAGEETAGEIARQTGIADELGCVPVRVCAPLDADSLSLSWAQMIAARWHEADLIEVMAVADDRCVRVDAAGIERALAGLDASDAAAQPDGTTARDLLAADEADASYVLLPPRFTASMRLRMSIERLRTGDLDDYATDEAVRRAVRDAVATVESCETEEEVPPLPLMLTGVAPFVWSQATRADLATDILSVGARDLMATEGMRRALQIDARARTEGVTSASLLSIRSAAREGLDELAHALAEHRAHHSLASDDESCFCGSGRPYAACCGVKGLDEIARAW